MPLSDWSSCLLSKSSHLSFKLQRYACCVSGLSQYQPGECNGDDHRVSLCKSWRRAPITTTATIAAPYQQWRVITLTQHSARPFFAKKVCVRKLKQLRAQANSDAVSFLQLDRTDIKSYVTLDAAQRQGFTRARLPPKGSESRALTRCPRITNTWLDECVIFSANYSSFASERLLAVVLLEVWWPWRCPWASQVHPSSSVQSV